MLYLKHIYFIFFRIDFYYTYAIDVLHCSLAPLSLDRETTHFTPLEGHFLGWEMQDSSDTKFHSGTGIREFS